MHRQIIKHILVVYILIASQQFGPMADAETFLKTNSIVPPISHTPSCQLNLTGQDPLIRAINGMDLRKAILSRMRFRGDLDFNVPEFQPILVTMLAQMEELENRLSVISPLNLRFIRRNITTPLQISSFRKRVQKMLDQGLIPYWETIDLVTRFNRITQSTTLLEGNMISLAKNERDRDIDSEMAHFKNLARLYPVVIVPSVHELSEQDINLIWSRGILPIGSTMKVEAVDGTFFEPAGFGRHDAQHAMFLIWALRRAVSGDNTSYDTVTDETWKKMDHLLSISQKIMSLFFNRLEQVADHTLRKNVIRTYFRVDHETQGLVSFVLRPVPSDTRVVIYTPEDREQFDQATAWFIKNWNASRLQALQ